MKPMVLVLAVCLIASNAFAVDIVTERMNGSERPAAQRSPASVNLSGGKGTQWRDPAWYTNPKALPDPQSQVRPKGDSILRQDENPAAGQQSPSFKRNALTPSP